MFLLELDTCSHMSSINVCKTLCFYGRREFDRQTNRIHSNYPHWYWTKTCWTIAIVPYKTCNLKFQNRHYSKWICILEYLWTNISLASTLEKIHWLFSEIVCLYSTKLYLHHAEQKQICRTSAFKNINRRTKFWKQTTVNCK